MATNASDGDLLARLHSAEWLPHRYDPAHDAIHWIAAPRDRRSAAPFLTDADLAPGPPLIVRRADSLAAVPAPAPLHFVFHSAYCCSTLVARAWDAPGVASALKEPQILNDLVGWRHRGGTAEGVRAVLDSALTLLARPFVPGEAVVVKPSNVVNGLAGAMLDLRPGARALLLHAPLPVFLASIARKGLRGRLWVRELLSKQLRDGIVRLGFEPGDFFLQSDLQVAAVGWLAQQALFAELAHRWPDRVRTLDSELLVARPAETMAAMAALFGLPLGAGRIAGIVAAEFARDAKDGGSFAPGQRERERASGQAAYREELETVVAWSERVAAGAGVSLTLPLPLLAR